MGYGMVNSMGINLKEEYFLIIQQLIKFNLKFDLFWSEI